MSRLRSAPISPSAVVNPGAGSRTTPDEVHLPGPEPARALAIPDVSEAEFLPPCYDDLVASLRADDHVMLTGPRGTGKTTAARMVARQFGRPLYQIQGHPTLAIEDMRGNAGLRGGDSTFTYSPVVEAAMAGAFLLFDELNLCRSGAPVWLNNVLDKPGVLAIPETREQIPVHSEFLMIACFNAGYSGTNAINEALLDRCRVIHCEYWPEDQEVRLLKAKLDRTMNDLSEPCLSEVDIRRMVRVANAIRQARRQGSIDFDFSVRSLCQWGKHASLRSQDLLASFVSVILPKVGDPFESAPQHTALLEIARLLL